MDHYIFMSAQRRPRWGSILEVRGMHGVLITNIIHYSCLSGLRGAISLWELGSLPALWGIDLV